MLEPRVRELAKGANFAAVSTLMPDGTPQTLLTWVDCDDEHLLVNTEVHRQRTKNVRHDQRVTVLLWDHENMYSWAEVRGRVVAEVGGAEARQHIDDLARKYTGDVYKFPIQSERVILVVEPDKQNVGN